MNTPINWFSYLDPTGYELNCPLPDDCVSDCSSSGDVGESVKFWVRRLKFGADPESARTYLKSMGAWEDEELADHDRNMERLLWQVACDVSASETDAERRDDWDEYNREPELNPDR